MRIIGGSLKGRKLFSTPGKRVRPTADRLRESLFNIISFRVSEAIVLDLFSGTGALGIEALSRGASRAVFVEKSAIALQTIRRNIQICHLEDQAHVIHWDIVRNLNCLWKVALKYDLVFLDPPYNLGMVQAALQNLSKCDCLNPGVCIVIEHSVLEPVPKYVHGFAVSDQRSYGKILVTFLTNML